MDHSASRSALPVTGLGTLSALLAVAFIGGCAGQPPKDEASPYYAVPAGSTLEIRVPVEFPPGRTRVFFQNGSVSPSFDHYATNCNLEIRRIDWQDQQRVEPGGYEVSRVQRTLEQVVQARRLQVAALGLMLAGNDGGSDGNAMVYEGYHMWLEGPDSNLMRLSCRGAYADPSDARPPSIQDIRRALGERIVIRLAP